MLPLRSSIMTTRIGWTSFENTAIAAGLPLSLTLEVGLREVGHEAPVHRDR
jgi:hypothetical protein